MKKIFVAGAIYTLLILLGCQTTQNHPSKISTIQPSTKKTKPAQKFKGKAAYVAINDFSILAADKSLKFLATEIPNDLAAGFAKGGLIKPVERQELKKVMKELKLSMSGLTDEEYSVKAGKLLGAKYILLGSMSKIGNQIRISCRLIETETAQIIYTESARGLYNNLFNVEDELKKKIETFFRK